MSKPDRAILLYRDKVIESDGCVQEIVVWQLPKATKERPHGFKYRMFYGLPDGSNVVRYDNETGKGDHRHIGETELAYSFKSLAQLLLDFRADVEQERKRLGL
jgi:hypothetical protein